MITANPVTRGDLRARFASPKIVWLLRLYLAVLGLLAVFTLPPESGRLPGLPEGEPIQPFILFQLGWVAYLTSALAVGEIGVEGEKVILDLAVTSFPARTIALGKLWTSLTTAAALTVVALPLLALIAPPDPIQIPRLLRALTVLALLAVPLAAIGTWLSAAVSSDLVRTVVHWLLFLGVFGAARWLPEPLAALSPLRIVVAAYRGAPDGWTAALFPYLACAVGATFLTGRLVAAVRREQPA
jgi:hypothetical protein